MSSTVDRPAARSGELATVRTQALVRVGAGLIQALLFYLVDRAGLAKTWPATEPMLTLPIVICAAIVPILLSIGIGRLRTPVLTAWIAAATIVIASLSVHAIGRTWPAPRDWSSNPPDFSLEWLLVAATFIAQSLLLAADADRTWRPSYPRLFEASWNLGVQLVLTGLFFALFWAILRLGLLLFGVVGLTGPGRILAHHEVGWPAATLTVAFAIHVTSLRSRLVDGVRMVLLTLLGFLLPVLTAIGVAFVLSLCFVSLQPLWRTHHALLLLSTAILLMVLLLNAAYRDGLPDAASSAAMRLAGRVGAVLLLPLVGLAMVALQARVANDGWSIERVLAAAWLLVCGLYAFGYAVAALRPGRWLAGIEDVNVVLAAISVPVLVALLTPLADPARIAVDSQVARLRSGRVTAARFDYAFLQSGSAGYGRAALIQLRTDPPAPDAELVRQRATAALAVTPNAPPPPLTADEINRNVTVHPAGRALPPTLLAWLARPQSIGVSVPLCLRMRDRRCDAIFLELRHDGTEQLAFAEPGFGLVDLMAAGADGTWSTVAALSIPEGCGSLRQALIAGRITTKPSPWSDLLVDGHRNPIDDVADPLACPQ